MSKYIQFSSHEEEMTIFQTSNLPDTTSDFDMQNNDSDEKKSKNAKDTEHNDSEPDNRPTVTVVVTGASGFVASYIIKELLESQKYKYKVIGTVRRKPSNYSWLHDIVDKSKKKSGKLVLTQVPSLEKDDAYNALVEIISEADYVMHVASPYVINPVNVYDDLLEPAVNGTENVLNACKAVSNQQKLKLRKQNSLNSSHSNSNSNRNSHSHSSRKSNSHSHSNKHSQGQYHDGDRTNSDDIVASKLKRVVITSSMAAVTDSPMKKYTENDWNLYSNEIRNAYYWSKTEAEKAAWRWMYKHGDIYNWDQLKLVEYDIKFENDGMKITPPHDRDKVSFDLCVCCPWMVIGRQLNAPNTANGLNTSNKIFVDLVNGDYPMKMNLAWAFVDVIDVAHSHIMMIENGKANGRYILAAETWTLQHTTNLLRIICKAENQSEKLPTMDCSCQCFGKCCMPCITFGREQGTKSYLETNVNKVPSFDSTRIRGLGKQEGFQFRPIEFCIQDLVKWQIQMGYIHG